MKIDVRDAFNAYWLATLFQMRYLTQHRSFWRGYIHYKGFYS